MSIRAPRLRTVAIPVLFAFTSVMVLAGQAHAEDINPVGIGDLFWSPSDGNIPEGGETMYELYDPGRWFVDADLNVFEGVDATAHVIVSLLMALLLIVGLAMTVIVGWVFRFTSIPEMEKAISGMIGGASQSLMEFILPSCLVVGGFIAFVQHRKGGGGGGLSQIAWVLISGVVSVSLLTSPQSWVSGVDSARQVGASVTMTATAEGLGNESSDYPFALKNQPKFTDNGRDTLLRKSQDSIWRGFVATPWCIAEFGSMEVCKKYGRQVLDQGTSVDKREEYIDANVSEENVGLASKDWADGDTPVGRIMVLIPAVIVALMFAILLLVLAFTSLAAFLGSLLLLLTGVFFACLWVIPGRPRQWGLAWFDQLLARTLESFIATLVLGAVLSAQTATMQMFGKYGWLPTMGLSIALSIVAFQFRSVLAQIFGVRGTTGGSIGGMLASRALSMVGKGGKGPGSGSNPRPGETLPGGSGGGGGGRNTPRLPSGSGGSGDGADITVTRVPPARPPAPAPLPAGRPKVALPAGRSAGSTAGSASGAAGTTTAGTAAVTGPAPQPALAVQGSHSRPALPAQSREVRPALPPGPSAGAAAAPGTSEGNGPSGTPASPVMRPETGRRPNFAFRQAPAPGSPGEPRVIVGTVVRSTPNGPPRGPARTPSHSFRPPVRRT
ncbi:hypothetical protein [Streptomyces sp. NBC_01408]|uniref:hypothetical protein n=1 Tax=Streptomyces sp. NBC_01408 TaxID=2903855 RepID=UPI002256A69A|nr:hypothetical protein [Streptomyces sp. NBC_01408]MCX4690944.1 hypothetical protein [Streptomyces sp. NBC_01408]